MVACTNPDVHVIDPRTRVPCVSWRHVTVASALLPLGLGDALLVGDDRGVVSAYDLRQIDKGVVWAHSVTSDLQLRVTDLQVSEYPSVVHAFK